MFNKKYKIKVYTKANVYKSTVSPKDVISNIAFSQTINAGQWDTNITLNESIETTKFVNGDLVKVYEYDDDDKTGSQVYFWYISWIERNQTVSSQTVVLECLGVWALLSDVIFYYGAVYNPTINDDPANIIKFVVDYFNSQYGWSILTYDAWSIIDYWSSINIWTYYLSCFDAIKNVADATDYYRFVDSTWLVHFKPYPTTATHKLTNQKDVESIVITNDIIDIVNKLHLERDWSVIATYQDATSQTTYGIREAYLSKTNILDNASQDIYGANYIADNKDPKKAINIVINSQYDIESINPWDTIKIKNFNYSIDNLQVRQTNYDWDKLTIAVEKFVSLNEVLFET